MAEKSRVLFLPSGVASLKNCMAGMAQLAILPFSFKMAVKFMAGMASCHQLP
jgi:hypothetical protein